MNVLLVEDDALIAMSLEAALSDAGHVVSGPAATASGGLEIAEAGRPDLALVDINLRDGSNGVELARELRRRWGVPCFFVSGQKMEADANQDAALGFIGKPYAPEAVVASIEVARKILNGRRPCAVPHGLVLY